MTTGIYNRKCGYINTYYHRAPAQPTPIARPWKHDASRWVYQRACTWCSALRPLASVLCGCRYGWSPPRHWRGLSHLETPVQGHRETRLLRPETTTAELSPHCVSLVDTDDLLVMWKPTIIRLTYCVQRHWIQKQDLILQKCFVYMSSICFFSQSLKIMETHIQVFLHTIH